MRTLLLVDDVELFLELERSHLQGRGYGIATATSGEQALARLEEVRPDLVLLDLYMPDMNGDEVCRRIRSHPEWQQLPVIMVTAAGKPAEIGKCLDAGCDDYITKPVNRQDLLEKVQRLLGKVRRRTAERHPVAIQVEVSAGGRNFTSYARDLSRNGIYIRSSSALAVNTAVELQLQFPEGRELKLMGRVKRVPGKRALMAGWGSTSFCLTIRPVPSSVG
jgi:CheY-like chemotaxis protein